MFSVYTEPLYTDIVFHQSGKTVRIGDKQVDVHEDTELVEYIGPRGSRGDQGDQGIQGVKGVKGAMGAKGDVGDKGARGDQGSTGIKGVAGVKGVKGEGGPTGDVGATGAKGDRGTKGAKGAKGDPGPPAVSSLDAPFTDASLTYGGALVSIDSRFSTASSFTKTRSNTRVILMVSFTPSSNYAQVEVNNTMVAQGTSPILAQADVAGTAYHVQVNVAHASITAWEVVSV